MSDLEILIHPDERLIKTNADIDIEKYGEEEEKKVARMVELLLGVDGVGLAAPQVGWNVRLFVTNMNAGTDKAPEVRVFWNPQIALMGDPVEMREGCLSMPDVFGQVKRHKSIALIAQTPRGDYTEEFTGLVAQALQHEYDHLKGTLFYERATPGERKRILSEHQRRNGL